MIGVQLRVPVEGQLNVRSADELDGICGIDDLDALIVFEIAQVRITGDD